MGLDVFEISEPVLGGDEEEHPDNKMRIIIAAVEPAVAETLSERDLEPFSIVFSLGWKSEQAGVRCFLQSLGDAISLTIAAGSLDSQVPTLREELYKLNQRIRFIFATALNPESLTGEESQLQ